MGFNSGFKGLGNQVMWEKRETRGSELRKLSTAYAIVIYIYIVIGFQIDVILILVIKL